MNSDPAFPRAAKATGAIAIDEPGMSLRDWFAGQAIVGWLASYAHPDGEQAHRSDVHLYAEVAYAIADAMIVERKKKP